MNTRTFVHLGIAASLVLVAGLGASADLRIGSPYMPATNVGPNGALVEDWGTVELRLVEPGDAAVTEQVYQKEPAPTVVTTSGTGTIRLTQSAYRAPVWPDGVDVLATHVNNDGDGETQVRLRLVLPDATELGSRVGVLGNRPVIGLPKDLEPVRRERPWGCTGGVVPMPGWATPEGECDAGFKNIRAGMGGVPIVYRFAVPPGAARTVEIGLCESFHADPGHRPVILEVEGAPKMEVDPLAKWGRHKPGCLRFGARDMDKDGRIDVKSLPCPGAPDVNPIINVIWVFAPEVQVDENAVLKGGMNAQAEYYVDAGGEKDQLLYQNGSVDYVLKLAPKAEQKLMFLVACPGCAAVPDPMQTAWTPATLRKAAEDVCRPYLARGEEVLLP